MRRKTGRERRRVSGASFKNNRIELTLGRSIMAEGGGKNLMQDERNFPKEKCAGLQNFPAQLGRQSHLSLKSFTSKLDKLLRKYIMGHIPSLRNGQTNRSF